MALTLERCARLGITVSHSSAIRMQTKAAAPVASKATSWREDTLMKSLQISFLKEVLKKQQSVQVNISRDEVSSYEGFEDSVHVESCKLLENTEGEDESGCLIYPRHAVSGAVEKLEKSIVHFK